MHRARGNGTDGGLTDRPGNSAARRVHRRAAPTRHRSACARPGAGSRARARPRRAAAGSAPVRRSRPHPRPLEHRRDPCRASRCRGGTTVSRRQEDGSRRIVLDNPMSPHRCRPARSPPRRVSPHDPARRARRRTRTAARSPRAATSRSREQHTTTSTWASATAPARGLPSSAPIARGESRAELRVTPHTRVGSSRSP